MDTLQNTGERQVGKNLGQIANDHVERYKWAAKVLSDLGVEYVADLACGVGYGANIMANAGIKVLAVDIDPTSIEFGKFYYDHENITWLCHDAGNFLDIENLPNVAVSFETIEHVEDHYSLMDVFKGFADVLICSVPNQEVVPFTNETHPFHYRHYTPKEFLGLVKSAGYHIDKMCTQYDKQEGTVFEDADDGRTLIVLAHRSA